MKKEEAIRRLEAVRSIIEQLPNDVSVFLYFNSAKLVDGNAVWEDEINIVSDDASKLFEIANLFNAEISITAAVRSNDFKYPGDRYFYTPNGVRIFAVNKEAAL